MGFDFNNFYKVDYIQSNGLQRLNIGVGGEYDYDFAFENVKVLFPEAPVRDVYIGNAVTNNKSLKPLISNGGKFGYSYFGNEVYSNVEIEANTVYTINTYLSYSNQGSSGHFQAQYIDGTLSAYSDYDGTSEESIPKVFVFGFTPMRLYSGMRVSRIQGDTLSTIREFVCALRKSDNKAGLYDVINNVFYGGGFTYGTIVYDVDVVTSNEEEGTVSGGGEIPQGNTVTISATPTQDYAFDYWEYSGETNRIVTDNPYTFTTDGNATITAVFRIASNVYINYDETLGTASATRISNKVYRLTATPNANAYFKGWYKSDNTTLISTSPIYEWTLDAFSINCVFERKYDITVTADGNGAVSYTRGIDPNDIYITVIADSGYELVKYTVNGLDTTENPLNLYLTEDTTVVAYFLPQGTLFLNASANIPNASIFISDNGVRDGEYITVWARPYPSYHFAQWSDGDTSNPRQIEMHQNVTLVAEYYRDLLTDTIYQYRCYVKDQMELTALPKAFMRVDSFSSVKVDLLTNANTTINVIDMATNVNNGDVLVLYDPKGTTVYQGVIKSIEDNKITCSQMQSFYKGLWIYNVSPQDYLEHEIAVLLQDYADGKIYRSNYVDGLVAQRLGGITIDYVGTNQTNLPTDLDKDNNEQLTQKDMEKFIYELYEDYGIIFDFEINMAGANYVHIKTPSYTPIKIGNNNYAVGNMSPITTVEETNRLIVFNKDKVYRTTYVARTNNLDPEEEPSTLANRFYVTNTKVVFSDDPIEDLVSANLPEQMYNHKLTFTLYVNNFIYEFADFHLGGELEVYYNDEYYHTVLTGYDIKKSSNQNITQVDFTCGKVRTALTKKLTMGAI